MRLETLFQNLSHGELSNLTIGGEGSGNIPEKYHARLVTHVNNGLSALYSRFPLLEKEVMIDAVDYITIYHLDSKFALTNEESDEPIRYIIDTPEHPFTDDVIKVLNVFDECGIPVSLNNPNDIDSIFTPSFNCLQIPRPAEGNTYFVIYQARHPVISADNLTQLIKLPVPLQEALQVFVAHKIFSAMNGQEHILRSHELEARYEQICMKVEDHDQGNNGRTMYHHAFTRGGWV